MLALTYTEKISEAEAWVLISDYNQVTCLHTDGDKDKMLVRVRKICCCFFKFSSNDQTCFTKPEIEKHIRRKVAKMSTWTVLIIFNP